MIASRFRTVGWVAGVATAALGCYLVSQSVAAERAALGKVDRQIADTKEQIARLSTEIGTRGRMSQLDRWNEEAFALQAPGARQFLASATQLASLGTPKPALALDPAIANQAAVHVAAYVPPAPAARPTPVTAEASPRVAAPAPEPQPMLRVASYVRPKPPVLAPEAVPVVKVAFAEPVAAAKPAPKAVAPKARKPESLLPDDIDSLVDAELKAQAKRKAPK